MSAVSGVCFFVFSRSGPVLGVRPIDSERTTVYTIILTALPQGPYDKTTAKPEWWFTSARRQSAAGSNVWKSRKTHRQPYYRKPSVISLRPLGNHGFPGIYRRVHVHPSVSTQISFYRRNFFITRPKKTTNRNYNRTFLTETGVAPRSWSFTRGRLSGGYRFRREIIALIPFEGDGGGGK